MPFTRRWATGREDRTQGPALLRLGDANPRSVRAGAEGLAQVKWNSISRRPTAPGHVALAHFLAHKVLRRAKIPSEPAT